MDAARVAWVGAMRRWAAALQRNHVADAEPWVRSVGWPVPEPAIAAERLVNIAADAEEVAEAVNTLEEALDGVGGTWLAELRGAVAYATRQGPTTIEPSFAAGQLAAAREARTPPTQREVLESLLASARQAVPSDGICFADAEPDGRWAWICGDEPPDRAWLDGTGVDTGSRVREVGPHGHVAVDAPVRAGGRRIGTVVAWRAAQPYREQECAALRAVAAEGGLAIEALDLAARARADEATLRVLYEVSCRLQASLDLDSVLDEVCASFCHVVGAARTAILEVRADGTLRGVAARGVDLETTRRVATVGLSADLTLEAVRTGKPVVHSSDRVRHELDVAVLRAVGVDGALACVPLLASDELLGLVFFDRGGDDFTLSGEDEERCVTVANLAALALQRARLHAAAQDTARLAERSRIAEDLHDSVVQSLFRAGLELRRLGDGLPDQQKSLQQARHLVAGAASRLRQAIGDTAPVPAPGVVIAERIRALGAGHTSRTGSPCRVAVALPAEPADSLATLLERFVAEGLVNVEKHAEQGAATVDVAYRTGRLVATVDDDGPGFPGRLREPGGGATFGLASLRDEARRWGGEVALGASPLGGARVTLKVPWVVDNRVPRP